MSSSKKLLQSASGYIDQTSSGGNVEDYFDATHWKGTGANRYIRTGVDLATSGEKGMVIIKNASRQGRDFQITDTVRGLNSQIVTNDTDAQTTLTNRIRAWEIFGFNIGDDNHVNQNDDNHVAYTFKAKKKFFDIQTYTGSGSSGKVINHNLGMMPSMFWIRAYSAQGAFVVWHRDAIRPDGTQFSTTNEQYNLHINNNSIATSPGGVWLTSITDTALTIAAPGWGNYNDSNVTYVVYFFGDYVDDTSFIKSGIYTGQGTSYLPITLGFEPQWLLFKQVDSAGDWYVFNTKSGISHLQPYSADNEDYPLQLNQDYGASGAGWGLTTSGDGFVLDGNNLSPSNSKYIYTAIRKGFMGEPTNYTQLFGSTNKSTNTSKLPNLGLDMRNPTDFGWWCENDTSSSISSMRFYARKLPKRYLRFNSTNVATTDNYSIFNLPIKTPPSSVGGETYPRTDRGWYNADPTNSHSFSFSCRKGFADIQTYRTTGTSNLNTVKHSLGAVPEFMMTKGLFTTNSQWRVYHKDATASNSIQNYATPANNYAFTNADTTVWGNTVPTDENFYVKSDSNNNATNIEACVWVGFSSSTDYCDISYYTGTGGNSNRTITTTLSGSPRLILIKPASEAGSWYWFSPLTYGTAFWRWNYQGRETSSPTRMISYGTGTIILNYNPSLNPESGSLGVHPLNKSGVRYIYVAFG